MYLLLLIMRKNRFILPENPIICNKWKWNISETTELFCPKESKQKWKRTLVSQSSDTGSEMNASKSDGTQGTDY